MTKEQIDQPDLSIAGWAHQTRPQFETLVEGTLGTASDIVVHPYADPQIGEVTRQLATITAAEAPSLVFDARQGRAALEATNFGKNSLWHDPEEIALAGFTHVIERLYLSGAERQWARQVRELGLETIIDASTNTLTLPQDPEEIEMLGQIIALTAEQSNDQKGTGDVYLPNGSTPEATWLRSVILNNFNIGSVWVSNEAGVPTTRRVLEASNGQNVHTLLRPDNNIREIDNLRKWVFSEPARVIEALGSIPSSVVMPATVAMESPQAAVVKHPPKLRFTHMEWQEFAESMIPRYLDI